MPAGKNRGIEIDVAAWPVSLRLNLFHGERANFNCPEISQPSPVGIHGWITWVGNGYHDAGPAATRCVIPNSRKSEPRLVGSSGETDTGCADGLEPGHPEANQV